VRGFPSPAAAGHSRSASVYVRARRLAACAAGSQPRQHRRKTAHLATLWGNCRARGSTGAPRAARARKRQQPRQVSLGSQTAEPGAPKSGSARARGVRPELARPRRRAEAPRGAARRRDGVASVSPRASGSHLKSAVPRASRGVLAAKPARETRFA
jgi:hypothetical protein